VVVSTRREPRRPYDSPRQGHRSPSSEGAARISFCAAAGLAGAPGRAAGHIRDDTEARCDAAAAPPYHNPDVTVLAATQ